MCKTDGKARVQLQQDQLVFLPNIPNTDCMTLNAFSKMVLGLS